MFKDVQTVMIVKNDGKEAQYAQLLFRLIGKLPNFESSQPVTETEYKASYLTIDSMPNGKVIFFGNGKEALIQGKSVNWQYDRFGMKYGWLGNRCVITADPKKILLKEQSAFAEYYNSRIEELCSIFPLKSVHYSEFETVDINEIENELRWQDSDGVDDKAAKVIAATIMGVPIMLVKALKGAYDVAVDIRASFERSDLWKRQYELLVCEFILNGFPRFMSNAIDKDGKGETIIVYDVKDAEYAHLLHNLIQQYSGYDVAEYTEKLFVDNAKKLSSKNKIIFLGKTKSSKERWLDIDTYMYNESGMHYGWSGNQAFVNVSALKKPERDAFIEIYQKKSKEFEDKAKDYAENNNSNIGKIFADNLNVNVAVTSPYILPNLLIYAVGVGVDKVVNKANTIADLTRYQYQLLLREFVFNGFGKFMEEI